MKNEFFGNGQTKVVETFDKLISTPFRGEVNAICLYRNLNGDFKEVVSKLELKENVTEIPVDELVSLSLSAEGNMARDIILNDFHSLTDAGAQPSLNLIKAYERDEEFNFISTDVYSFHVDRSPVATDTFICTYYGSASDILPGTSVKQKILIPEIIEKLKELHEGPESEFENFMKESFFDLHYQPEKDAVPLNLGAGHLWKLAVDYPGQQALPCVHRAPLEKDGEYRLILIC